MGVVVVVVVVAVNYSGLIVLARRSNNGQELFRALHEAIRLL